jgi:hypothetical protein
MKCTPTTGKRTGLRYRKNGQQKKVVPDGVFKVLSTLMQASMEPTLFLGLLYGEGDYGKTIDISTRAGMDSDCNPANAAGILGTMLGYSNIPDYWKQGLIK